MRNAQRELHKLSIDEQLNFDNEFTEIFDKRSDFNDIISASKYIFSTLAEQNIKTIVVIDEFDSAMHVFEGKRPYYEFIRTLLSDGRFFISSILISRRQLQMIEVDSYGNSTFQGIFNVKIAKGFNDKDMNDYYRKLEKYNISLTEEQKNELFYYAGRSPYLLSIMGNEMVEQTIHKNLNVNNIDIHDIYQNKATMFMDYYNNIKKRLENDKLLDKIVGLLLGPILDISINDIDNLKSLGYIYHKDGIYYCISPNFTAFLKRLNLNLPSWQSLMSVEKHIKLIIDKELINIYPGHKEEIEMRFEKEFFFKDVERYKKFLEGDRKMCPSSRLLDVISLKDSIKILKKYWDKSFAKYFNGDTFSRWDNIFSLCIKVRNPLAHGHENYLTETTKFELQEYCRVILNQLSSGENETIPYKNIS